MALLPLLVGSHVALALALLVPSVVLPFALRAGSRASDGRRSVVRALLAVQARSATPLALAVAATGLALVAVLGSSLIAQPWLVVALAIYAANLALAFFVQRPNLLRLAGIVAGRDDSAWRARARRQRYVSYAMAGLIGTIAMLMSTKPVLW